MVSFTCSRSPSRRSPFSARPCRFGHGAHRGHLALDEFVEEIPFRETRHYVRRVLGNLAVYSALYGGGRMALPERVPASVLDNINF